VEIVEKKGQRRMLRIGMQRRVMARRGREVGGRRRGR
jgi:hypothetical protein